MSKVAIEKEMVAVVERINARAVGIPRDRSDQLTFGDRCYLNGLAFAVARITGEKKQDVISRIEKKVQPPKKRKVVVRRKR